MRERTLVMVKPDAVRSGHVGDVIGRFESAGLTIRGLKMVSLDRREAEGFYRVHQGKSFFSSLTQFMSSGPIVAMVLEGPGPLLWSVDSWAQPTPPKPIRGRSAGTSPPTLNRTPCTGRIPRSRRRSKSPIFLGRWKSTHTSE